jgi:hypothetical protein
MYNKRNKKNSFRRKIEELIEGGHSGKRRRTSEKKDNNIDNIVLGRNIATTNTTNATTNTTNATTNTTNANTTNANTSNVNTIITAQRWVPGNEGIYKYSGINKINL